MKNSKNAAANANTLSVFKQGEKSDGIYFLSIVSNDYGKSIKLVKPCQYDGQRGISTAEMLPQGTELKDVSLVKDVVNFLTYLQEAYPETVGIHKDNILSPDWTEYNEACKASKGIALPCSYESLTAKIKASKLSYLTYDRFGKMVFAIDWVKKSPKVKESKVIANNPLPSAF